ncbi:MAG: VWA domain-containing protein, partial [Dokdonella sp.]
MSALPEFSLSDFHFLRPLWLLLLLGLPLLWLTWRRSGSDAGGWRHVVDRQLLPYLLDGQSAAGSRGGPTLAAIVWVLACLALAGPAWEREPMPLYRNQSARVIALELAPSMLAQDVKPSRLERVRYKIDDLLTRSRDYQTALIGYAGDAFVAAPLTDDVNTVRNLVQALDPSVMPVAGNATETAIERGVKLIKQAGLVRGEIILVADSVDGAAVEAARQAREQGVEVSILGVGTAAGAPVALGDGGFLKDSSGAILLPKLDEAELRSVAAAGGGRYASVSADAGDLDALLGSSAATAEDSAHASEGVGESSRFLDRGPWLVLLILPLALAGFRRGWLMTLALACLVPIPRADAASLSDLWQRADQQAAQALDKGDAKHALEVAKAPEWRGSAAFRSGEYATAAKAFTEAKGADADYNEGNALAKIGKYEEALAAYDSALKQAPDMDDAIANRKA